MFPERYRYGAREKNRTDMNSPKSSESDSEHKSKTCYIKVVLPSQNEGRSPDIEKARDKLHSSRNDAFGNIPGSLENRPLGAHLCSRQINGKVHVSSPSNERSNLQSGEDCSFEAAVPRVAPPNTPEPKDIYKMTDSCREYTDKNVQTATDTLLYFSENNVMNENQEEIQHKTNTSSQAKLYKNKNISGSFMDIGEWQNDLKKASASRIEQILQKRTKTFPPLNIRPNNAVRESRTEGSSRNMRHGCSVKGYPFKFEYQEDLTRYIRDYRNAAGGRKTFQLNGSHGSQRSLGVPGGFRVKTSDPARTMLPHTPNIASDVSLEGGCVFCEREKFRLRNSFPKRVFLSWSQYMTLCKSNTDMMSQQNRLSHQHEPPNTPYPSPRAMSSYSPTRAVTSYSPTRPLRLLSERDKALDLDLKYQATEERKVLLTERRRSIQEQNTPAVDKTLLMYRLSEKMKNSVNPAKF